MKRHVHARTPACKPRTFQNCTGEPAKGVPYFACKKFAGSKKYAALALCVSLWMAGGGVASAGTLYLDADQNDAIRADQGYPSGAKVEKPDGMTKTLSVTKGSDWTNWDIYGGKSNGRSLDGYTLTLDKATKVDMAYGAYTYSGDVGTTEKNVLNIIGGSTVSYNVYGGYTGNGAAANNEVAITKSAVKGDYGGSVYGGYVNDGTGNATGNKVTVTDCTNTYQISRFVYGGYIQYGSGNVTGNEVTVKNSKVGRAVYGGFVNSGVAGGTGEKDGNKVTIINSTVVGYNGNSVYGGYSSSGNAVGNIVEITDGSMVSGDVYGGRTESASGVASGNKVAVANSTVNFDVYGGWGEDATGNTVALNGGATVNYHLWGGYKDSGTGDFVTGNTLNLSGTSNTVGGTVQNFETIKLAESFEWNEEQTVLNATSSDNQNYTNANGAKMTLDISEATKLKSATPGTMTLLTAGNTDAFKDMPLKYFNDGTATLNTTGIAVFYGEATNAKNGVTLTYDARHTVKLEDSNKIVTYNVTADPVKTAALGEIEWNTSTAARTAGGFVFNNATAIDKTNFAFINPLSVGAGESMTLLANATGLVAGASIAHTQTITKDETNGTKLTATLSGNITRTSNTLGYTATGTTLNSVNLANWNGETGALPTGWTGNGVAVNTGNFAAPAGLVAGEKKNILTATTDNFFGTVSGANVYKAGGAFSDAANGVTLAGNQVGGVLVEASGKELNYYAMEKSVGTISLGNMTWGTGRAAATGYNFANVATVSAANLKFSNPEAATGSTMLLSNATNLAAGDNIAHAQNFTKTVNGATLSATLSGTVTRATAGQIGYTATGTTLTGVNLANWNGTTGSVPTGWTSNLGANSITAAGFDASGIAAGTSKDILTATTDNFFNDNQITGAMKYAATTSSDTANGVTLTGLESKGVKASDNGKSLVYERGYFNANNIAFGEMIWGTARDASAATYNYTNANIDLSKFMFETPEAISSDTTTLLEANDTLAEIAATEKNLSYTYTPVSGVRLDGIINGSYATTDAHALQYTATANQATKLTFGDVAWKDSGALMTRPANITFAGADVDTTNINFTNIQSLEANKKMTLVSDFGDTVGTITGAKYKVGSTLEGEGKASLVGNDLIFTAETGTSQEQSHNTVMGAEVGMAALSAGNDFIGAAAEGLALASNVGADGVSSFAQMGGGSIRQETGSHIDAHTWNAIIALGHQNKKERSTFEYGAFFEYGTGNYTTHNGDERGDGSTHYTGGGLLAKWTANHGLYVEGSLRAGNVHDDARNVLRDGNGVPYSYETNAPYFGGHIGVGKEITLANGNVVDAYGKYFYNRRNGVSFDAGGHYDLDAVTSQVLRVGARYTVKQSKWNLYAGVAYEHELDGKASGTADGMTIRGADTSGGSFRGELGASVTPDKNVPVTLDFNVTGFAGKKQGFSGGVSVAFMF